MSSWITHITTNKHGADLHFSHLSDAVVQSRVQIEFAHRQDIHIYILLS